MKKDNVKTSYEYFKDFIKDSICDENIKKEIIEQLKKFFEESLLVFCGNDLCGKIKSINGNDYLEIKCGDESIVCSYTNYNFKKKVTIIQSRMNNVIKLERKENSICDYGDYKEYQNVELERIYDENFNLLYESLLTDNSCMNYCLEQITYIDKGSFFNKLCLNRKWFLKNGSIVYYKLSKNFVFNDTCIKEGYSICIKPRMVNYVMVYDLEPLDEILFNKLMIKELSIDEVVKEVNIQKVKKINNGG